jgi:hypothetical protein
MYLYHGVGQFVSLYNASMRVYVCIPVRACEIDKTNENLPEALRCFPLHESNDIWCASSARTTNRKRMALPRHHTMEKAVLITFDTPILETRARCVGLIALDLEKLIHTVCASSQLSPEILT